MNLKKDMKINQAVILCGGLDQGYYPLLIKHQNLWFYAIISLFIIFIRFFK